MFPLTGFLCSIGVRIIDQTRLFSNTPRTPTVFLIQQSCIIITFQEEEEEEKEERKTFWFWFSTFVMLFSATRCVVHHENTRR